MGGSGFLIEVENRIQEKERAGNYSNGYTWCSGCGSTRDLCDRCRRYVREMRYARERQESRQARTVSAGPFPTQHELWCAEWGYGNCGCDLDVRQAAWNADFDRQHRAQPAKPLPVAIVRLRHKRITRFFAWLRRLLPI